MSKRLWLRSALILPVFPGALVLSASASLAAPSFVPVTPADGSLSSVAMVPLTVEVLDYLQISGLGGGGRVALELGAASSFDPLSQIDLSGGIPGSSLSHPAAAPGTAYVFGAGSVYGDLYVLGGARTTLLEVTPPALGRGEVALVEAAGADLWIEPRTTDPLPALGVDGMWLRIAGVDYRVVEQSADRRRLRLTAAAGLVTVGESYAGIYKFDNLILRGGATVRFYDEVEIGQIDAESGSEVIFADLEPPTFGVVTPAEGALYSGGDPISVTAEVSDNRLLTRVTATFAGLSYALDAAPFAWTLNAPPVQQQTVMTLEIEAEDGEGNLALVTRHLTIEPTADPSAPQVLPAGCPAAGDWVLPGATLSVIFDATDDQQILAYGFSVDGVRQAWVENVYQDQVRAELSWTVPATAVAGDSFVVTFEAEDLGGHQQTASVTVSVPAVPYLAGDQDLDSSAGGALVLSQGLFTATEPLAVDSLRLLAGARLSVAAEETLDLQVLGAVRVQCDAVFDLGGRGYQGGAAANGWVAGAPSWVERSWGHSGGSHGGSGEVVASTTITELFDSVYAPTLPGGGASHVNGYIHGGHGGGVLHLDAGEVILDGLISVAGEDRDPVSFSNHGRSGTGAGGSVWIRSLSLSGAGSIDAAGGHYLNATAYYGGVGGGGRVALEVDDVSGFDLQAVDVGGGLRTDTGGEVTWVGDPGTFFLRDASSIYGELLASRTLPGFEQRLVLPTLAGDLVSATEVVAGDLWITAPQPLRPRWLGAWMELFDGASESLGVFQVVDIDAAQRVRLQGAAAAQLAAAFEGRYRFDAITLDVDLRSAEPLEVTQVEVIGDVVLDSSELRGASLAVRSGATLRTIQGKPLQLQLSGSLIVEAGATIDLDGTGYLGGVASPDGAVPAGIDPARYSGGGSHGGLGLKSPHDSGSVGEIYDSVYAPIYGGGGGGRNGSYNPGGNGGGVLLVEVDTVVLDGLITARGEGRDALTFSNYRWASAGAGGAVWIRATTLSGSGSIDVSGGDYRASDQYGGGIGAGGRVALEVADLATFDLSSVMAAGGLYYRTDGTIAGAAEPGTIYVADAASTFGDLRIPTPPSGWPQTLELPLLGSGTVLATEVAAADLWVAADASLAARWRGAWMELSDPAGILDTYRVIALDSAGRALLQDAATVAAATSYRGEYRFDNLHLGTGLLSVDELLATASLEITGEAEINFDFVGDDVTVRAGAVLRPSPGRALHLSLTGALTVETGATIDLDGAGYTGGGTVYDGAAPPAIEPAHLRAGGSHGGLGLKSDGSALVGEIYDSVYAPSYGGGGGGSYYSSNPGGSGGGSFYVEATTVVLDGLITARGQGRDSQASSSQRYAGAGAGGAVWIRAATLGGSGSIDVTGGDYRAYDQYDGGLGGGGRAALEVDDLSGFDLTAVTAAEGLRYRADGSVDAAAEPGTIYVTDAASTYGDLHFSVSPSGLSPVVTLPSLGSGGIVTIEVEGGDLWVSGTAPFRGRWLGAWMALQDSAAVELGTFRVLEIDLAGRLLLGGGGTVGGVATYRGEYRFDAIVITGGGSWAATDPVVIGGGIAALVPLGLRRPGPVPPLLPDEVLAARLPALWLSPLRGFAEDPPQHLTVVLAKHRSRRRVAEMVAPAETETSAKVVILAASQTLSGPALR